MMVSQPQPPWCLSLLLSAAITASFAAPLAPPTKRQEGEYWDEDDGDIKGAEGASNASFNLSKGAIIAIIVVAVVVAVVGSKHTHYDPYHLTYDESDYKSRLMIFFFHC